MEFSYTPHFKRKYKALPDSIKKKFKKQLKYLLNDLNHPSLRVKKYDEAKDIWQARVDKNYRFYFQIKEDTFILLNIRPHP